ncbi:Splicing factor 45 [Geranomyces variabilis]|uniref:Splicing factor 45 n=1 Tax=Geranomyces variabilis TaxID=109894 RepID=A0AAD5XKB4_9FUNG|nr:Splicing factor 45 [Geranomyces variabilis]
MASLYAALDAAKSATDKSSSSLANEPVAGDASAPEAKKVVVPAGWSATQRLLQPAPIRRKPPPAQPKPRTVLKDAAKWAQASASLTKPLAVAPAPPPVAPRPEPDAAGRGALVDLGDPTQLQRVRRPGRGDFDELYEPGKPNDYHHLKQEAKRRKQELRQPQHRREERSDNPPQPYDRRAPPMHPPAPAPASAEAASGEEAYLRRMRMANPESSQHSDPTKPPSSVRDSPLSRPPSPNVHPQRQPQSQPQAKPAPQIQQHQTSVFAAPLDYASKVVLLKNMVGSDGVDEDLQQETADECKRFGAVQQCVVYEVPYQAPDHEAVRIFVAFSAVASARKAQAELNGRYFGGRAVIASFYDEKRFQQGQYED